MNMAENIQMLRKRKGISQEELADQIGVSRQAVGKWESGQSAPDPEKIILLSDYFETTTDFILKGIQPPVEPGPKGNAMVFSIVGTTLNAIGLVSSIVIWLELQVTYAVGVGLVILLLGTGIFLTGQFIDPKGRAAARKFFLLPNVWILLLIPLSCCFNILNGWMGGFSGRLAPIPLLGNSIQRFLLCWAAYLTICVLADLVIAIVIAKKT